MKVHELLTEPARWTQDAFARDERGHAVSERGDSACSWCLVGAVQRCYSDLHERAVVFGKIMDSGPMLTAYCVSEWNDAEDRRFAEVRALVLDLDI